MPGASTLRDSKVLENMVKKHAEKGKLYAAVCASPAVALGAWGLLNGLKVILSPIIHFFVCLE
jgi:4-methyl-5(b-hydroxyethyl)-thiazole monophosphate biosynthesis